MAVGDFLLQIAVPDPRSSTVRAAAVGEDQQAVGTRIITRAICPPSALDRIDREGRRLARRADYHQTGIAPHIVDAVGQRDAMASVRKS